MSPAGKFRAACYTIEGLNSFAVVIYFNYLYFYFRDRFGFNDRQNLELAALIGVVYVFASLGAGKFAKHCGYFTALKLGFAVMAGALAVGSQLHTVAGAITAACVANAGMCFIWPVLEAFVSEGRDAARAVGIYNITWATTNASAFFIGGTLIEKLGYQSIFYVPLGFMGLLFAMVFWLERVRSSQNAATVPVGAGSIPRDATKELLAHLPGPLLPPASGGEGEKRSRTALKKSFQRMAWLANPFAYIAINTLIAVLPGIAHRFNLSPMLAGFACSLWCFARVGAFVVFWQWTRWHYRFRFLVTAFGLMIISFAVIIVAPSLAVILAAQVVFGVTIGLMYYSSLFYAMDGEGSGSEHGGIHEAAIGIGNCLGPAAGAAALWLAPQNAGAGAWAVSGLLTLGLGGLVWLRKQKV
ncbi:MAG: MFS transporter [Verrucomicrobiae bacterium]|nr:MFS transporter [Verrucomicrobiae bacterium]